MCFYNVNIKKWKKGEELKHETYKTDKLVAGTQFVLRAKEAERIILVAFFGVICIHIQISGRLPT